VVVAVENRYCGYKDRRVRLPAATLNEVYQIADAFNKSGLIDCWIELETDTAKKFLLLMYWDKEERVELVENLILFLNKD
jgi:hypothetical protein